MNQTTGRNVVISSGMLVVLLAAGGAWGEEWPGWRGPRGDGSAQGAAAPLRWSGTENVNWRVEIPGVGHGSPIVWGDRLFLTTCLPDEQARALVCVDRTTGRILWRKTVVNSPLEPKHNLNSHASGTPATDGERVYVTFLDRDKMLVAAYDFEGNPQWLVRPGVFSSVHGYCSSPVLYKDLVIVNGDHDGPAYIVALDRRTGKTVWKIDRENNVRSYCTPIIREIGGRTQMILSGSKSVASYDPNTGKRHWVIDGPTDQFVASVVYNGSLLFMTCGYPERHMLAIRPDGEGNVTQTHIAWRARGQLDCSYVPSPAAVGKWFVVVSDFGIASCFEAATGRRVWREKIGKHYSASIVTVGDLAYFLADSGEMTIIRPGERFEVVARNELGEECYASPAISEGQMFLRGQKHLYSIGKRVKDEKAADAGAGR